MNNEIWKDIKDYVGNYEISNFGNIRRKDGYLLSKKFNKQSKKNYTTVFITLSKNGQAKTKIVSRLVAEAFISNPYNKPQVNHKDFNPLNNHVSNLEWVTVKENIDYSVKAGRYIFTLETINKNKKTKKEWESISERFMKGEVNFSV